MLVQMSPIVGSSNKLANEMHSGQLRCRRSKPLWLPHLRFRLDQLLGYVDLLNSGWVPVLSIGVFHRV